MGLAGNNHYIFTKKKKKGKADLFIIWIFMLFRKMFLFRLV